MSGETWALVYLAAGKGVTYLGFLGLAGAVVARLVLLPTCRRRQAWPASIDPIIGHLVLRVAVLSALLLIVAAAGRVYAQTYSVFGLDEPVTLELMQIVAFETRWGQQWRPQLVTTVLAVGSVGLAWRVPSVGWWLAAASVLALAAALPMTGHAMSHAGGAAFPWMLQVGHGLAAGLWLGTLAAIATTVFSRQLADRPERHGVTAALVDVFSPLAVVAVVGVVVTGLTTAVLYISEWSQLWEASYGRTLLAKVGLVLVTGAAGAYNWKRLKPRLGSAPASGTFSRSASIELALAGVVLALTAVLVHLPMPGE